MYTQCAKGCENLLTISLSTTNSDPFYQQIIDQLRNLILSGHLAPGEALPSVRSLARQLTVSVITTRRAYDELERAGLICTRAGMGSYVTDTDIQKIAAVRSDHIRSMVSEALGAGKQMGLSIEDLRRLVDEELSRL